MPRFLYRVSKVIIESVPGFKRFGFPTLLPWVFLAGAAYEFTLIHLTINGVNFYEVYKSNQLKAYIENRLILDELYEQDTRSEMGAETGKSRPQQTTAVSESLA